MKPLRLLALLLAATAWCTSSAFACDASKTSAANSSSCSAKSASAHAGCAARSATTATAASATPDCCAKGKTTAAVAASSPKSSAAPSCGMSAEQCKAMQASGACNAQMKAACAAKGARTASAGACVGHSASQTNCAVCSDEMECDDDVRATGARAQIVSLRNGAMIVYTLDGTENVRALQAAVARHNQGVVAALQGDAKLCGDCKKLRGALASGKLTREVINVERGCQLLITSSDRSIVQQVQACANAQVAVRTSTKL